MLVPDVSRLAKACLGIKHGVSRDAKIETSHNPIKIDIIFGRPRVFGSFTKASCSRCLRRSTA
jgi:hypothetical protein